MTTLPSTGERLRPGISAPTSRPTHPPRRLSALLATAAMVLGTGAFLLGSTQAGEGPRVGPNQPINFGANDLTDINAHNTPTIVANPLDPANLAVVNRIDTPSFSCALHVSFDDGASWSESEIPFPAGEELPERCFAPDATFASDGTLHVSFVTLAGQGNVPNALWLASSPDGGRTLSPPQQVAGPLTFQARLSADPETAGRLYLSWVQASDTATLGFPTLNNPVVVARSDDGGATWAASVVVNGATRRRVLAPSTAVGNGGTVLALYLDLGDDVLDYQGAHEGQGGPPYGGTWTLVLARSNDAGSTWTETVVDRAVVPTERVIAFFPPSPSLAINRVLDRVFVGFSDGRAGDADVWMWASKDGGTTFSTPVRVNDTNVGDGTSQYLAELAVSGSGRIDVAYYDRRSDPDDVLNEVSLQSSADGGTTFGPRLRVSDRSFDSRIGFGSERNLPDLGSRLGLSSSADAGHVVWSDTRSGTQASNKQDLAHAVVDLRHTSVIWDLLRYVGFGFSGLGAIVLGAWAVGRWSDLRRGEIG